MIKIGHRGAAGYEPENTLISIKKALELKVDIIELDVYCCQSGELVLFHDPTLERTTNGKGYLIRKSYAELQQLDAGKGERIPTLESALKLINRKAKVNIELKGRRTLHPVLHMIEKYVHYYGWQYDDFLISSFKRSKLKKIRKLKSKIPIGALLLYRSLGFLKFSQKIKTYAIHVNYKIVNSKLINDAHKKGIKIFVWTVNDLQEITYFKKLGVDGIFSDYPDRIGE